MLNYQSIGRYVVGLAALFMVAAAWADEGGDQPSAKEKELLAVLQSDAPAAEKAITCKLLAIDGSSAAVPDLARLLPDERLSSWARIALEAIPGPAADKALRDATDSLQGKLLVGTINSIGVRRDAAAVELLSARLQDKDADVASAAAVALGRIANAPAAQSLRGALAVSDPKTRSAVAEGCVLCAERLHADGKSAEAAAIYDEVRQADIPKQRIIEATRGAILARNLDGLPLLMEQFRSSDKALFQLALGTAREFPGGEVDKALAAEVERATPERAALILTAMADRPKTVVLPAVLKAAQTSPKQVRVAAIAALGCVGDATCLPTLLDAALDADSEITQTAKTALADLASDRVDAQIVALLRDGESKSYTLLIELVGQRRIDAVPEVLQALENKNQSVRRAALVALGETVSLKRLPVLISLVIDPKYPEDAQAAQQALLTASIRMPDREACAAELSAALDRSPAATKSLLLEILAEVGGKTALATLAKAAKSGDAELQDAGSRLLGKWNSVEAAPVLLDLAKTAAEAKYQVRALRGYIGLARKFDMPDAERVAMCQTAFNAARRLEEQELVLDVLAVRPSADGLKLAVKVIEFPELKEAATRSALIIAQKIGGKGVDVSNLLSSVGLDKVKLEIIKAEYGAGSNQKDVTAVLRKVTGESPLITLPATNYNACFGGDPAPGVAKQLRIQYRMNGKASEATFDENSLIILRMPD